MMINDKLLKIQKLYSDNVRNTGVDSRSVGWNTEDCQRLRFIKLMNVIDTEHHYSVNDYGCGYGAMLKFMERELGHEISDYHGYDISPEMLDLAHMELASSSANIDLRQQSVIETEADYSFVSGTFNVRFDATKDEWMQFIKDKLIEMDRLSRRGFAFNLLTSYVDWEEPHLFYGDPCYWFGFCKNNFSKKVSLIHDYNLWEWTMIVKK